MEEPLAPREFLRRYNLPQLVRINEAHLHQLNASKASASSRNRGSIDSTATGSSTISSMSSARGHSSEEDVPISDRNGSQHEANLLDLDQPFLLYKAYSCRQVISYTLNPDGSGDVSEFKRKGSALLIPENYSGWFAMVTSKGHTAGYFSTIDEIARAQVPYFLTRDDIMGYSVPRSPSPSASPPINGKQPLAPAVASGAKHSNGAFDKTTVGGGTVLRFLGVYEDISAFVMGLKGKSSLRAKRKAKEPGLSGPPFAAGESHGIRYAKCISFANSSGGEIVFIPITEAGRFYVIAKRATGTISYNHVYSISNLLRVVKLPATVQLVVGPKPRNYSSGPETGVSGNGLSEKGKETTAATFSAILRLEEMRVRDVILASTIRPQPFHINAVNERNTTSLSASIRRTLRGPRSSQKADDAPVLLEFDLDSCFSFVRTFVERNGTLTSRKIPELVVQRIGYCNAEAETWKRQIKIAHDIIPRLECDSGPTLGSAPRDRKSLFEEHFKKKGFVKNAGSIGSRASSNVSNASRLSKILHRFWNPLRKTSSTRRNEDDLMSEFEDIPESCDEKAGLREAKPSKIPYTGEESDGTPATDNSEYHFYETLKRVDEATFYPPKQRLSRKQTLDVIFSDLKVDDNGYILSNQKNQTPHFDDSLYSTVR